MTERDLDWVGHRVVDPIVRSVFTSRERSDLNVSLSWGPEVLSPDALGVMWWTGPPEDGTQWVLVKFVLRSSRESAQWRLCTAKDLEDLEAVHQAAVDLGGLVEDWFCETRVGWGQQRHAMVLPSAEM